PSPAPTPSAAAASRSVASGPRPPVSVVILTLNEEINIPDCLASCAWCDDVHVLDSGSEDGTQGIARSLGAAVHEHPFESFGKQRNWAIDNIPLKHEWVFHLDADERFTPDLVAEMDRLLATKPPDSGFHCPSKMMFMGRWLKRAGGYPTYQMRLFHKSRMRFKDYGHGQREAVEAPLRRLREPYLHYSFSKGLYDWLGKQNRYSSLGAVEVVSRAGGGDSVGEGFQPRSGGAAAGVEGDRVPDAVPAVGAVVCDVVSAGRDLRGAAGVDVCAAVGGVRADDHAQAATAAAECSAGDGG